MGLSNGQKKRLYGDNTQAKVQPPRQASTSKPAVPQPRIVSDYSRAELAAQPGKGGSYIFLGVAFTVTLLFMAYYYLMLLPSVSQAAGQTAPELMLSFDSQQLQSFAAGLGVDGLEGYQILHRSTGLILPLIFAFTWWNMVKASGFELLTGRLMKLLPLTYALVFIAGGFALDSALANPLGAATGLASLLMSLRWLLLLLCLAQLAYMGLRLIRGKVDAFAEGELPGQ